MKNYWKHINDKPTHERRQHAMQLATALTGFAVLVWVTTLGVRFAMTPQQIAQSNGTDTAQTASVVNSDQGNATLIVATTTNFQQ
jgi:hypothetical protein